MCTAMCECESVACMHECVSVCVCLALCAAQDSVRVRVGIIFSEREQELISTVWGANFLRTLP